MTSRTHKSPAPFMGSLPVATLSARVVAAALLVGLGGCAENGTRQCNVGADCVSGVCRADGTCVEPDGGVGIDGATVDVVGGDAPLDALAEDVARDAAFDAGSGACAPNRDGRIERSEVPLAAGLRATFLAASDVTFDTRGQMVEGVRTWDLSGAFDGDAMTLVETRDPSGQWFSGDFAGASYVTELSLEQDLLGVFEITSDALLLRGVVSPEDGFARTNLENDPPVTVLSFPLERDKTWSSNVNVSGFALGVFGFYSESYSSRVDAVGTLITPFGRFTDVQRVRTQLTRTTGLIVTTLVSFAFVSECFGTIATLTGQDNDDGAELSELAEVRRLAP